MKFSSGEHTGVRQWQLRSKGQTDFGHLAIAGAAFGERPARSIEINLA